MQDIQFRNFYSCITPSSHFPGFKTRSPNPSVSYNLQKSLKPVLHKKNDTPSIVNESSFQKMYRVQLFMCFLTEIMHFFFHQHSMNQKIL
jgi:hypothetical protein